MNKTERYALNQWAMTDRIQMKDFNDNNLKIEDALDTKLRYVTLLDETKTVENATVCSFDLNKIRPHQCLAIFVYIPVLSLNAPVNLFQGPSFKAICSNVKKGSSFMGFPLWKRETMVNMIPIGGSDVISAEGNGFGGFNAVVFRAASSSAPFSGTIQVQVTGIM